MELSLLKGSIKIKIVIITIITIIMMMMMVMMVIVIIVEWKKQPDVTREYLLVNYADS